EAAKVIVPVSLGGPTTPVVTWRHLRQTQAQDTRLFRSGHCRSLDSTRRTISPRSSGRIVDHRTSSSSAPAATSTPSSSSSPSARSGGGGFLADEPLNGNRSALCLGIACLARLLAEMTPLLGSQLFNNNVTLRSAILSLPSIIMVGNGLTCHQLIPSVAPNTQQ
ncbi:hypothetical protein MUK42_11735, partial [Musa troglodytarum]